jgi:hypothetical protein
MPPTLTLFVSIYHAMSEDLLGGDGATAAASNVVAEQLFSLDQELVRLPEQRWQTRQYRDATLSEGRYGF